MTKSSDLEGKGRKVEGATKGGSVVQLVWFEGNLWMVCPLQRRWLSSSPAGSHEVPLLELLRVEEPFNSD